MNALDGTVTSAPSAGQEWESHAAWWQENFTEGADPEYVEQILPLVDSWIPKEGLLIDIGCGEGQISRLAASRGLRAVGLDVSSAQLTQAAQRSAGCSFAAGSADRLPLRDGVADAAVVCLVYEHVARFEEAIAEAGRVIADGGVFLLLLNHPLLQTPDSGWVEDYTVDPPDAYWQIGPYLRRSETLEEVESGVFIRFFHRPLSAYLNCATACGLTLERMEEPAPPPGFLARSEAYAAAAAVPRLLALRFRRQPRNGAQGVSHG